MQRTKAGLAILFLIASAVIFSALMEDIFRDRGWLFASEEETAETG